ncbi:transposase, partial [Paracoccus beibuensis]|uniref:transposase n=1 Tax=Paracoccus beibuensis TaxID=547602 RepID=UPI002240A3EC
MLFLKTSRKKMPPYQAAKEGFVSDLVEIGWRRDLQVDTHPSDRRRHRQGDHAMKQNTDSSSFSLLLRDPGAYDPIEDRLRANVRATIEAMFEEELADFLGRLRYGRGDERARGYRHGHRDRQLTGTFGTETVRVPRARIEN